MFQNRKDAGLQLARRLNLYKGKKDVFILAIPRGGVEVAYYMSKELELPLDVLVIKKLGFPGNEEFAIGAVGLEEFYINEDSSQLISKEYIEKTIKEKQKEAKEKYEIFRGKHPPLDVEGKTIILVDDGIATGSTMQVGIKILKKQNVKEIVVAVPVAPPLFILKLENIVDRVFCIEMPNYFNAVGQFYQDFEQVDDKKVKRFLENQFSD